MRSEVLIDCFADTLAMTTTEEIRRDLALSIQSNRVYPEGFIAPSAPFRSSAPSVHFVDLTTLKAAKLFAESGKVAVLNFANPFTPGGGVTRGAVAQEESLCRSSTLYPCLMAENVQNEYYIYHRKRGGSRFSDRLIYTENVLVFKDDQELPQQLDKADWFHVDIITCAAPYSGGSQKFSDTELGKIFRGRIKNIFEAAVDHQVDVLILGAFGCGAFGNPPELVACAFRDVLSLGEYAAKIPVLVFAFKKPRIGKSKNAEVFKANLDGCAAFSITYADAVSATGFELQGKTNG